MLKSFNVSIGPVFVNNFISDSGDGNNPPVWNKLLVYAKGPIIHGADVQQNPDTNQDPDIAYEHYRYDEKSGFHLFVTPNGDPISQEWDTSNATYLAWHDILLIDPTPLKAADALGTGPFFFDSSGNPVARTMSEMINHASTSDIFFFCQHNGKYEFRHYNEVLTGQELADAISWCD